MSHLRRRLDLVKVGRAPADIGTMPADAIEPDHAAPEQLTPEPAPTLPPRLPAPAPVVVPPSIPIPATPPAPAARTARRPPRSPWWHTVVRSVILIIVVASVAAALALVVQGYRSADDLPEYGAPRPSYGTAVVDVTGGDATTTFDVRLTAGPAGSGWLMDGDFDGVAGVLGSDGTGVWATDGRTWIPMPDPADVLWMGAVFGRVTTFDMIVPPAAAEHFEVIERDDVVLDGRNVERVELVVAERRFQVDDQAAYADWIGANEGDPAPDLARLRLHVDEAGVVWQLETWSDRDGSRLTVTLVSFDDGQFTNPVPAPSVDVAGTAVPPTVAPVAVTQPAAGPAG